MAVWVQQALTPRAVLREQLIAAQQHLQPQSQESRSQPGATADQSSNIDPAISGTTMLSTTNAQPTAPMGQIPTQVIPAVQQPAPAQAPPQEQPRKTTGKRELSTSKRAAQNRAAQVGGSTTISSELKN